MRVNFEGLNISQDYERQGPVGSSIDSIDAGEGATAMDSAPGTETGAGSERESASDESDTDHEGQVPPPLPASLQTIEQKKSIEEKYDK